MKSKDIYVLWLAAKNESFTITAIGLALGLHWTAVDKLLLDAGLVDKSETPKKSVINENGKNHSHFGKWFYSAVKILANENNLTISLPTDKEYNDAVYELFGKRN